MKKKLQNGLKKTVSSLVALALLLGLFTPAMPLTAMVASAAENGNMTPAFVLGTQSKYPSVVGFGGYEWYVIGQNGTGIASSADTLTLMAKSHDFGTIAFNSSGTSYSYNGGDLQTAMMAVYNGITNAKEKGLVLPRTIEAKSEIVGAPERTIAEVTETLTDQYFWPLSTTEAEALYDDSVRTFFYSDYPFGDNWWLRSPGYLNGDARYVPVDGRLGQIYNCTSVRDVAQVRPAFNIDISSAMFTFAKSGGVGGDLSAPSGKIKFTMQDAGLTLTSTDTEARAVMAGETVNITYSGATTGVNKYVSCLIEGSTGDVLYYGKLKDCTSGNASGTATLIVPKMANGSYTIKLFSEEGNADNYTDFCSTPISIPMTVDNTSQTVGFAGQVWDIVGKKDLSGTKGVTYPAMPDNSIILLVNLVESGNNPYGFTMFDPFDPNRESINYSGSVLQNKMAAIADSLPVKEQGLIIERTITPVSEKLWPLSVEEANMVNTFVRSSRQYWWLRTPGNAPLLNATFVELNGNIHTYGIYASSDGFAVARPAFNLNLDAVLFTSAASGTSVKSSAIVGGGLVAAPLPAGTLKYTMQNAELNLTCTDTAPRTVQSGETVNITYSGATTGENRYVSCVIVNEDDEVVFYGKLKDCTSGNASGTASFTVPAAASLPGGSYTIKLFSDEINADNYTDFCSTPISIPMTVDNTLQTVGFAGQEWDVIGKKDLSGTNGVTYPSMPDNSAILLVKGDNPYGSTAFDSGAVSNDYNGSTLQNKMADIAGGFPAKEQGLISERTLTAANDGIGGADAQLQRLWPLSVAEANMVNGDVRSFSEPWWLRSPGDNVSRAAVVSANGDISAEGGNVDDSGGARPAFNLNLSSVLFTSAASGTSGKFSATAGGGLVAAPPPTGTVKFTVQNAGLTLASTDTAARSVMSGDTVNITYSGATTGANKYVSCVIEDCTGNVLFYGKLADCTSGNASGTVSFTVPTMDGGSHTIKLFSEEANGDNYTDFCSAPISIPMTVSLETVIPIYEKTFPDANFRGWILGQAYGSDGYLTVSEIATVTSIDVGGKNISDLKGIQYFTALESLNCESNSLETLDVSGCTALKSLNCESNSLETLDVSGCTALQDLRCNGNPLKSLKLANGDELTVQTNRASGGTVQLAHTNQSLLPSKSITLTATPGFESYFKEWTGGQTGSTNPAIFTLSGNMTVTANFGVVGIAVDENNFPDANFRNWILGQPYGSDGYLTESEIATVTSIDVFGKNISDLTGIQYFTALESLDCYINRIRMLDVSNLTRLTTLRCEDNGLETLNVSGCTALKSLYCMINSLETLDVSGCTALQDLQCNDNRFVTLDVSGLTALQTLYCFNNSLETLNVSGCTALQELRCNGNSFVTLDVSGLTALEYLNCGQNNSLGKSLETLNVSGCTALQSLYCSYDSLVTLDVSGLTALQTLYCFNNSLETLNVSGCTALQDLRCYNNSLEALDISGCTALQTLYCYGNSLETLDVSGLTMLQDLRCYNNSLVTLDTFGCTALVRYLQCYGNPLHSLKLPDGDGLTVLNPAGGGTVRLTSHSSNGLLYNRSLTLTAEPDSGYKFAGWTGDQTGSTNPVTFILSGNMTLTANFEGNSATVTDMTVNPGTVTAQKGTTHQFSAVVNGTDYPSQIVTWTVEGGVADTKITAGGALTVSANETATTLTVRATSSSNTGISGTAMVTVNADKNLASITPPTAITGVANGAAKTASALGLPSTVTLVTDDGNVQADVTWDVDSSPYDPSDTAEQTFTVDGTVTLPSGVVNTDSISLDVSIDVTVNAAASTDKTLVSITAPADITGVANGTAKTAPALGLPEKVTLVTDDGSVQADVTWDVASSSYNQSNINAQTFTVSGTVTLPADVINPNNVSLSTSITVSVNAGSNGGGGGGGTPSTPSIPEYHADVDAGNGADTTLPVSIDKNSGSASVDVGSNLMSGGQTTVVMVPSVPDVDTYTLAIPVPNLTKPDEQGEIAFKTDSGSITVPSNMLTGVEGISGSKAQISIGQGDKSTLPDDVKATIGNKPLVQLTLSIDGKQTDWSNPNVPVTVSIPYTPTAAERANPESIVIWYVDGSGNVVTIPNGHYDAATGTVTFDATHFSYYAVSYNKVSFSDVAEGAWYKKAVSFIAARGITGGTGGGNFSPDATLKRGDFLVLLMKAYGIDPDVNSTDNFSDAGNTYYTGYLATAKRLGITAGVGSNQYVPNREITRQEMFTLLYNTLKVIGQLPQGDSGKTLSDFTDAGQIDAWAKDAMTLLVKTGTVGGSGGKLTPAGTTTRAEMAQVLYNLLAE